MNSQHTRPLAVVTGASSGIGYELARLFAEKGYDLVVNAEDGGIVEAAQGIATSTGASVTPVQADLRTWDGVESLWRRVEGLGRPVDAIALNAGVGVGGDFARQTDLKAELDLIALNVASVVHLAKRVVRHMVERGEGRILFTSSVAAVMPAPFEAVYGASRAFVQSFAAALRNELKDTGVSVTALMPGPTETNFFHRAGMDDTRVGQGKKDDAADVARDGLEALLAGKDHVVAGSWSNKAQALGAKLAPQAASAELHRHLSEPGSGRK